MTNNEIGKNMVTFTIKKDAIINALTMLLFASFVIFDNSPYISFILFCISVVIKKRLRKQIVVLKVQ